MPERWLERVETQGTGVVEEERLTSQQQGDEMLMMGLRLDEGIDVPGTLGLAGFNGVDLLDGLPRRLATMDTHRREIGRRRVFVKIC